MNNFDFNFLQPIKLFLLIQIIYYRKVTIKVQPNHTTVDEKIINNWGLHIRLKKGIGKQISVAYYIIPSLISLQVKKWHNTYVVTAVFPFFYYIKCSIKYIAYNKD